MDFRVCAIHGLTEYSVKPGKIRCRKCAVISVQKRRNAVKAMAIKYKGGCCVKCGYSKSIKALAFHHLDPSEKDFGISDKGYTRGWKKIKVELDKCILVCHNCHAEIHEELDSTHGSVA